MAAAKDILQDPTTGDLKWSLSGDFDNGFSDQQHVRDIIESNLNDWKEYPLCGVGINNYLNSSGTQLVLKQEITKQLTTDGYGQIDVNFVQNSVSNYYVNAVRN